MLFPFWGQVRQVSQLSRSDWSAMISLLGHIRAFPLPATPPTEPGFRVSLTGAPHPLAEAKQTATPQAASCPRLRHPFPTPRLRKAFITANEGLADFVSQSAANPLQFRVGLGLHTYNWPARWLLYGASFTRGLEVKNRGAWSS